MASRTSLLKTGWKGLSSFQTLENIIFLLVNELQISQKLKRRGCRGVYSQGNCHFLLRTKTGAQKMPVDMLFGTNLFGFIVWFGQTETGGKNTTRLWDMSRERLRLDQMKFLISERSWSASG